MAQPRRSPRLHQQANAGTSEEQASDNNISAAGTAQTLSRHDNDGQRSSDIGLGGLSITDNQSTSTGLEHASVRNDRNAEDAESIGGRSNDNEGSATMGSATHRATNAASFRPPSPLSYEEVRQAWEIHDASQRSRQDKDGPPRASRSD